MSRAEGYVCYRCNRADDEPAGPKCANPNWHEPTLRQAQLELEQAEQTDEAEVRE